MSFRIPKEVKEEVKKGLLLHSLGYKGATDVGLNRGKQLLKSKVIDKQTARIMRAWFARHVYTSRPGYIAWKNEGSPVNTFPEDKSLRKAAKSYLLWGGDSARLWLKTLNLD